jgi:ankyrin repeat protein
MAAASAVVADAAMNRDLAAVRSLLGKKADVNAPQADGATALHWAARWNDVALTDILIQAGANVTAANRFGVTPLSLACINGSAGVIQRLLDAGAEVNALLSANGETALMFAARTGDPASLKILLDRGAAVDVQEKYQGETALMWAAAERHAAAVKALIARGANVNAKSNGGVTALHFATRENDAESVRSLLEAGAAVNQPMGDGTTALIIAIINGHYDLAMHLMEKGADANLGDSKGRTPLYAAIEMRNMGKTDMPAPKHHNETDVMSLIRAILSRGVDVNTRLSARLPYRGGLNPSWLPEPGATPFYRAAASNDVTMMRLLLQHGADPKIAANDKTTPLMVAAGVGWLPAISFTWTEADQLEALKICLENGIDIDAANNAGVTALHGAAFRGATDAIRLLVERGARMDLKDKQARVALNYAEGIAFGGQPPRREEKAIALLRELMTRPASTGSR